RRIIPAFPGWRSSGSERRRARPGFANLPDRLGFGPGIQPHVRRIGNVSEKRYQLLCSALGFRGIVGAKLRQHVAAALGHEVEIGRALLSKAVDDAAFKPFQTDRIELQNFWYVI